MIYPPKNILQILIIFILSIKITYAQPIPPLGMKWEVVEILSDEFDSWNENKWNHSLWNYTPPNIMMKSQSTVANGNLQIKAEKHSDSIRWMKTGRVMSRAKIGYPIYTECRMKASNISAYNTFWLNNGNAENRNEIDVCENNANPTNPKTQHGIKEFPFVMQSNIHHAVDGINLRSPNYVSTKDLSHSNPNKGKNVNETYHTIGVYWENNRNCHWFLDGEYAGLSIAKREFTRELYLIFDHWSNSWDGFPTKESLNDDSQNTMFVDWVHTYRLVSVEEN